MLSRTINKGELLKKTPPMNKALEFQFWSFQKNAIKLIARRTRLAQSRFNATIPQHAD